MEPNRHGVDQEIRGGTCPVYGLEFRLSRVWAHRQASQRAESLQIISSEGNNPKNLSGIYQ